MNFYVIHDNDHITIRCQSSVSCIAVFTETTCFLPTTPVPMETKHCWVSAVYWLDLGDYSIRGSIECSVETSLLLQNLFKFTKAHGMLSKFTATMLHLFYSYHQPVIKLLFLMLFSELFSLEVMSALIFVSLNVMLWDHNLYFLNWLEVECYCF